MHAYFLALACLPTLVIAAEIPRHHIGKSCAAIRVEEANHRSVPIKWRRIQGFEPLAYTVSELTQHVPVLYMCKNGRLWAENHFLWIKPLSEAGMEFHTLYDILFGYYGPAFHDWTPWQRGQERQLPNRFLPKSPAEYMASWSARSFDAILSVQPNFPGEKNGWRVAITVTIPSPKARSNNPLDRSRPRK